MSTADHVATAIAITVRNCEAIAREHFGHYAAYAIREEYPQVFTGPEKVSAKNAWNISRNNYLQGLKEKKW